MGVTKDYYDNLIMAFKDVCQASTIDSLNIAKKDLLILTKEIKEFYLFPLKLSDTFLFLIENPTKNFKIEQKKIAEDLYICLGELLFSFEHATIHSGHSTLLEYCRTRLPYEQAKNWNITTDEEFSMNSLFFNINRRWLDLESEEDYLKYKKQIEAHPDKFKLSNTIDTLIPFAEHKKLQSFFETCIGEYRSYINEHYPTISSDFTAYTSNVRIYVTPGDRAKNKSDIIQINMYDDLNNNSVYVYPSFLNFTYRFSNLEKIDKPITNGSLNMFDLTDYGKYNFFTVNQIHHELNRIFINRATVEDLKEYLVYLLRGQLFQINLVEDGNILEINKKKKCRLILEDIPNLEQLNDIVFNGSKLEYHYLAFKTRPDRETLKLLNENSIEFFIIEDLGRQIVNNSNGNMIHWFIKSKLSNTFNVVANENYKLGNSLISRLESCPLGSNGWAEFEKIGMEIFRFLFKDDFRSYISKDQSYTFDKIFRRDLIINNNFIDSTSFWSQMKSDFNCNIIVVDFKNYSSPLEQNEFYLPSKYLNLIIGKFAIIFSRKGLSNSSQILQRRMFNTNNEFVLCLDEEDLIEMLKEKMNGLEPSYRLENLKFQLYELS